MTRTLMRAMTAVLVTVIVLGSAPGVTARDKKKDAGNKDDPYPELVWPPPPDEARIKLDAVISGRADVEAKSKFKRALLSANPQSVYDKFAKPQSVAFDREGRILVSDTQLGVVFRFDRSERKMDVFGAKSRPRLRIPLGMDVAPDGTVYVADAKLRAVVAFADDGTLVKVIGGKSDLVNPTDVAVSRDGKSVFVADSKAHKIVVFEIASGNVQLSFGENGEGPVQFNHPTSVTLDQDDNLIILDQLNCRVQVVSPVGEFVDQFGSRGSSFGQFVRPKDVAVDERGLIYVTDFAFNNLQLFDIDFRLLTYVGAPGVTPGHFSGASGVATHGAEFAVVDQLGKRLQVFRLLGVE